MNTWIIVYHLDSEETTSRTMMRETAEAIAAQDNYCALQPYAVAIPLPTIG